MITTSIGLFDGFSEVKRATEILLGCGFSRDELSVVTRKSISLEMPSEVTTWRSKISDKRKLIIPTNLDTFIVDTQPLFLQGIGWVAMAGPLAYVLVKALDETQSEEHGDLVGAVVTLEVLNEEAEFYAEGVRRGGTLLAVTTAAYLAERAEDVLLLHGAVDVRARAWLWQQQGWQHFSPTLEPFSIHELERERYCYAQERKPGRNWTPYDRDFRSHFSLTHGDGELSYESYASAYSCGYQLASAERYETKNWDDIEMYVRRDWERDNEKAWAMVVDAIRYGFFKGREHFAYRA